MPYQKAVTDGKSLVVAMTHSATAAKANWKNLNTRPPRVPGMPWMSFILALGAPLAASVSGGASIGCTAGWLTFIASENKKKTFILPQFPWILEILSADATSGEEDRRFYHFL